MKALTWHGKRRHPLRDRARPQDRTWPGRHHQGDRVRHLRLRPASVRRRHADDGKRRHARPRDHGRGRRGRRRQQGVEGRRPRRGPLHHLLRRMLLLQERLLFRLRALQSQRQRTPRSCGDIRRPACSAIRTCSAASPAGRRNIMRVPYADVGPIKVPDGLTDEQVLFLSDIFPTGYMAADFCDLKGGETVAVWGCGPVGQLAIKSAFLLGAERVIAIDTVPERLALAEASGAVTLDFTQGRHLRPHPGADAWSWRGRLHRCRRHRTQHPLRIRCGDRPHQERDLSRAPTVRTCCGRPFIAAATSARCRSSASMAASSTRFRWAARSIAASPSRWRRRRCSIICRS